MIRVNRRILVAAFLLTLFVYAKCIEPNWLEVTRLTLETNQKTSHPLKIAFLTDLHLRSIGFREEQILRRIQIEKPDVIFIGGDSIAEDAAYEEFEGQYTAGWYKSGQSRLYACRDLVKSIFDIRFF